MSSFKFVRLSVALTAIAAACIAVPTSAAAQWDVALAGYGGVAITPDLDTKGSAPNLRIEYLDQEADRVFVYGGRLQVLKRQGRVAWGPEVDIRHYRAKQSAQEVEIRGTDNGTPFSARIPLPRIEAPITDITFGLAVRWLPKGDVARRGAVSYTVSGGAGYERQRLEFDDAAQLRVTDTAPVFRLGAAIEVAVSQRAGIFLAYDGLTSKHTVNILGESDTTRNTVHHVTVGLRVGF